jgi:hypothetical protein
MVSPQALATVLAERWDEKGDYLTTGDELSNLANRRFKNSKKSKTYLKALNISLMELGLVGEWDIDVKGLEEFRVMDKQDFVELQERNRLAENVANLFCFKCRFYNKKRCPFYNEEFNPKIEKACIKFKPKKKQRKKKETKMKFEVGKRYILSVDDEKLEFEVVKILKSGKLKVVYTEDGEKETFDPSKYKISTKKKKVKKDKQKKRSGEEVGELLIKAFKSPFGKKKRGQFQIDKEKIVQLSGRKRMNQEFFEEVSNVLWEEGYATIESEEDMFSIFPLANIQNIRTFKKSEWKKFLKSI